MASKTGHAAVGHSSGRYKRLQGETQRRAISRSGDIRTASVSKFSASCRENKRDGERKK